MLRSSFYSDVSVSPSLEVVLPSSVCSCVLCRISQWLWLWVMKCKTNKKVQRKQYKNFTIHDFGEGFLPSTQCLLLSTTCLRQLGNAQDLNINGVLLSWAVMFTSLISIGSWFLDKTALNMVCGLSLDLLAHDFGRKKKWVWLWVQESYILLTSSPFSPQVPSYGWVEEPYSGLTTRMKLPISKRIARYRRTVKPSRTNPVVFLSYSAVFVKLREHLSERDAASNAFFFLLIIL